MSPSPSESARERGARKRRMGALGSVGYNWQREGTASVASVGSRRCSSVASGSESGVGGGCCAVGSLAAANSKPVAVSKQDPENPGSLVGAY